MSCVYIIRNTINEKVYIGQTVNTAKTRFKKHKSMVYTNGCSALYPAFKKYGVENFYVDVLADGNFDLKTLNCLEKRYIKEYNSLSPNGYNLTTGGDKYQYSEETSIKKRESMKGRVVTWGDKVSKSIEELWKDKDYRKKVLGARGKRGKYKTHTKPLRIQLPIEDILKMHSAGDSVYKISKTFNVSFYTIKRRIQNYGN